MIKVFDEKELKKLYKPSDNSSGEDNGQITIIGGSRLFHGAPLFGLKVASRLVDMVFFATLEKSVGYVAEQLKSKLLSFVWIPWEEASHYVEKSDAILIGPGFMRFTHEQKSLKQEELKDIDATSDGKHTRNITKKFLTKFPNKRWVIDAGSLQVMDVDWIPEGAIVTPNRKEFEILFRSKVSSINKDVARLVKEKASKYKCTIVLKGPETIVASPDDAVIVKGGNAGMTKGGTGDVLAGLSAALLAKNDSFLAASAASFIEKKAADELYKQVGTNYNADDLADKIPQVVDSLSK